MLRRNKSKCIDCKKVVFTNLNVAKHVCNHLIGEHHTLAHRMLIGILIMAVGELIGNLGHSHAIAHIAMSGSGSLIHAIGAIPFVEKASKIVSQ
jgi:hypothetical protein